MWFSKKKSGTDVKKPKIIVIGCGEHARMVIDNIEEQNKYEVFGLTTASKEELDRKICGYPVICKDEGIKDLLAQHKDIKGYILGVGMGNSGGMKVRMKIYTWLDKIIEAVNIIHPMAIISKQAKIGKGNLIEAFTKVANGAVVGLANGHAYNRARGNMYIFKP